jgi:anti-sigma B factor antagonist
MSFPHEPDEPGFSGDDLLTVRVEPPEPPHDAVTVLVDGDVDLYTVPLLAAALIHAEAWRARLVVVDLSMVGYVGARCLGALIAARERALLRGGELRLAGGPVARLLTATGLDTAIEHYPDRLAALCQPVVTVAGSDQSRLPMQ